ncbi:hypothetical protein C8R45DRAFT_1193496 [Mycena sanguinolenta]|nr:hypothetical protein C8R45DRAFT_1193496 [Mycena sanguinolenta]
MRALRPCHTVVKDLNLLNDGLYEQGKNYDVTNAELRSRVAILETANKSLRAENSKQGSDLAAVRAAIERLEISSAIPLVLRTDSVQGRPPVTTRRRSPSPVPRYCQNQQLSRPRSHSPQRDHIAKRLGVEEPNAFIAFGPLADSVETPQKLFELHLRTAIPQFRLEAPYVVELDPGFAAHVRITVKSAPVARALMDPWATQNVAGYAKIKMVAMTSASGQEAARGGIARHQFIHRADNQDGVKPTSCNHYKYNLLNVICWNVLKSNTLISLVVKLPRKLNMSRCGSLHAFCKGKTYDEPLVNWWTLRIFTWEERTLPAHQL